MRRLRRVASPRASPGAARTTRRERARGPPGTTEARTLPSAEHWPPSWRDRLRYRSDRGRRRGSTRGVEQAADRVVCREPVVELHGGACLLDVNGNAALPEKIQSLGAGLKDEVHPATQHDHAAA